VTTGRGALLAGLLCTALAGAVWAAAAQASDFQHPASQDTSQQFAYGRPLGPGNVQRQDTPDDPIYDQAEPDALHGRTSTNLYDERFDLFGFPSQLTPLAIYRDGPHAGLPQISGFNAAGAWKAERGRPDVVIAILDTGILWSEPDLRLKVHLNTGELPYPLHDRRTPLAPGIDCERYRSNTYDPDGDGIVNVDDWACDPRVPVDYLGRTGPPGLITAQDLIHAFGDCEIRHHEIVRCIPGHHWDNDHNGYANDIAGWNFFDDSNDPTDRSSYFGATDHGTDRALQAAAQGDNGIGSIGVCPNCQIMPVRVWDTFVTPGDTFALGTVYATDNGASVIEGADGNFANSRFAAAASQYAYEHGVVQVYSGDDANTADHNYPANYPHTILVQGTVPDTVDEGQSAPGLTSLGALHAPLPLGTNAPVATYFRGANLTQYGGHSSITMEGSTGSDNAAKGAGAAALVISAGLDHGVRLTPDEVRELLEQTAERVTTGDTLGLGVGDPGASASAPADQQWTAHFGWGRVNLGGAVQAVIDGRIPPQAAIDSPGWFAPLTGSLVRVTGVARARFAPGGRFHWLLQWAPGQSPAPGTWRTVAQGEASGTVHDFAALDLGTIRAALAHYTVPGDPGGPTFAPGEPNPFQQDFTIQLEVSDAQSNQPGGLTGIDRRVLSTFTDPTLEPGYPRYLGSGGEAGLRFADLRGNDVYELLVPGADGLLRAYEPDGHELPGWPVHTRLDRAAAHHLSAPGLRALPPAREPLRTPVIADLDDNGRQEVIDTAGTHLYVWNADGRLRSGFPVSTDLHLCRPALERQPLDHPKCGFYGSPAIGHLEGLDRPPDIVAASLDGHLYAWNRAGHPLLGFPVALQDPSVPPGQRMIAESIDDPAIGDLDGSGHDDVVIATNEIYAPVAGDAAAGPWQALINAGARADGTSSRVYAVDGRSGRLLPGWPIDLDGVEQSVLPFVGPGQDAEIMRLDGREVVVVSTTGGALAEYDATGQELRAMAQNELGSSSDVTDRTPQINAFESAAIGQLLPGGGPAIVKYGVTLGQVENLLAPGQNFPYNHTIGAFDAATGQPLAAWPTVTDDYQVLSASEVVKLQPGPTNQVLAGTGLGLLHAYDGATGKDIASFPKVTGGWLLGAPALAPDGRLAAITREGWLFVWRTRAPACQSQWPAFRHDQEGSGNYNTDATPPAAPTAMRVRRLRRDELQLSFTAPGDNYFCGRAAVYRARALRPGHRPTAVTLPRPGPGGRPVSLRVRVPPGTWAVSVQAIDAAGNLGPVGTVMLAGRRRGRTAQPRPART
jgi:hypothetical protein